jgi:hypothetical protein
MTLTLRLPTELLARLRQLAEVEDWSLNKMIVHLLRKAVGEGEEET